MKYVMDSCVALKWVLPEPDSARALKLRADARMAIHELLAPDIFPVEVGHALTRAERQGRVVPPDGWLFWQSIMADRPLLSSSYGLMPRAYEISSQMRVGVYDCLYVALAEQEGCVLITADNKMIANLQSQFPFIIALGALP